VKIVAFLGAVVLLGCSFCQVAANVSKINCNIYVRNISTNQPI
jgi:hypothetical protein